MDTLFLLMARYNALPIIPIEQVRLDFFNHLSLPKFMRKLNERIIALPVVSLEPSQKSQRGVHIEDLALFLDNRRDEARKLHDRFHN
ncbi:pyocin activator PrtN family protein [Tateyamaria sp.]|uniref:pyocin activator PrtN family protein n=1 Tax=Tateyamaria sp. TaxID=1929288 RepID=UPI00329D2153